MVAVTGANGLLGSFIIRKLVEENEPFIALKRSDSNISLLQDIHDKVTWLDVDILNTVTLEEVLQKVDSVIHAAALVSFDSRDKKNLYNINTIGTRNIVNACLHHNISRLTYISSVSALSRPKGISVVDESQKWTISPHNTYYGETKYLAELEVMRGHEEGLNTCIINPSVILAPTDWNKSSARIFNYVWNENKFYTAGEMNYIDVRDVVSMIWTLIHSTENRGQRIIANAGTVSFKTLFDTIAKNFNKKPPSFKVNKKLLKPIVVLEQIRSHLTGATPLITTETAHVAEGTVFFNNKKAKNLLDIDFRSFDETINWCCQQYLSKIQ